MKRNSFFKCIVVAALALAASVSFGATALPHHFANGIGLDASSMLMGIGSLAGAGTAFNKKIRELMARKSAHVTTMRAITDKAAIEGRDPTADELTQFDAASAAAQAAAAGIEREQALLALEASAGVVVPDDAHITATANAANDPKRGFKSIGEFYASVAQAGMRKSFDERLTINAQLPTTFSNESGGTDGGFAIPPAFSKELWRLSLGEDSLVPKTANTVITGNSMIFPKDESTPWGGSGANVFWQAEGSGANQSKVSMGTQAMVLHKLMGLVPVTNELVEDGFAIGSYLTPLLADRITWKVNESILFGTGVGQPLGALTNAGNTGSPTIVQAKEAGQLTATIDPKNITKMVQRLLVGELKNAFWLATPDILTPLEAMTIGQFPIYLPNTNMAESPYGLLKGRPLMLSEHANAFSSQSDLSLISLAGYRTITQAAGIQTDTSMHLFFDADATAMRIRFRINGAPILGAPVVPPKSAQTRSHFVTLQAR